MIKITACVFFVLAFIYSICLHSILGMDGFYDTGNYHYFIGWAEANNRMYDFGAVAFENTFLNPRLDSINFIFFNAHPYIGAFFHSIFFATAMTCVYKITEVISCPVHNKYKLLPFIAAIFGGTAVMHTSLFGSFTNENIVSCLILIALLLALIAHKKGDSLGILFICGLICGLAMGLKLTATIYVIALMSCCLVFNLPRLKCLITLLIGVVIGYIIIDGEFMLFKLQLYSNPVFPLFNGIFKSDYYPSNSYNFSALNKVTFRDFFTLPYQLIIGTSKISDGNLNRDGRILLGLIGIIAFILNALWVSKKYGKKVPIYSVQLFLIAFIGFSWLIWFIVFHTQRYLIPLELLSGVILFYGIANFVETKHLNASIFYVCTVFIFAFIFGTTVYPDWGRRPWDSHFLRVTWPVKFNSEDLVFISGRGSLSFLVPSIALSGASVANIFTQRWADTDSFYDLHLAEIKDIDKTWFLQYDQVNPITLSNRLKNLVSDRIFQCRAVGTSFTWFPLLCKYIDVIGDKPINLNHKYNSTDWNFYYDNGWNPTVEGIWSQSQKASITIQLPKLDFNRCSYKINIKGRMFDPIGRSIDQKNISITYSDINLISENFDSNVDIDIPIRKEYVTGVGGIKLDFTFTGAMEPNINDARKLSFILSELTVASDCKVAVTKLHIETFARTQKKSYKNEIIESIKSSNLGN
jgi:hypothetical protein